MILVDTSVWVEVFRAPSRVSLVEVADFDDVVTCLPIVQEVLQGFRDERAYRTAKASMLSLPVVESPMTEELFIEAAALYRAARRFGTTVRSSTDCLIAACALRSDLEVLHADRDFEHLGRVAPLRVRALD